MHFETKQCRSFLFVLDNMVVQKRRDTVISKSIPNLNVATFLILFL